MALKKCSFPPVCTPDSAWTPLSKNQQNSSPHPQISWETHALSIPRITHKAPLIPLWRPTTALWDVANFGFNKKSSQQYRNYHPNTQPKYVQNYSEPTPTSGILSLKASNVRGGSMSGVGHRKGSLRGWDVLYDVAYCLSGKINLP